MVLAAMLATDEDAVICDIAQYYNVYDLYSLPIEILATLSAGLPADSRIMRKLTGSKVSLQEELLAAILDDFNLHLYSYTKDAKSGRNKPKSIVEQLSNSKHQTNNNVKTFSSIEAFETAKKKLQERR